MNSEDVYTLALRPRSRVPFMLCFLFVCGTVLGLGGIVYRAVEVTAYWDFQKSAIRACVENGGAFAGGECMPIVVSCPGGALETRPFEPWKIPPL